MVSSLSLAIIQNAQADAASDYAAAQKFIAENQC